jgi:PIN domain nuclease of toxin-antitoxin system
MILLDTQVVVWAATEPKRLSKAATAAIRQAQKEDGLAIAAISLWELAMLIARGRILSYGTVEASVRLLTEGLVVKPITAEIAALAVQFVTPCPLDHADRLIGATAQAEGLALVTRNEKLRSSRMLQTIW